MGLLDSPLQEIFKMGLSKMLKAADHPMLMGKGGRMPNNEVRKMQGMNLASLRHHVALQPLAVIMVGGMIFVGPTSQGLPPRPLMSTGSRPGTLETIWATTRPGNSKCSTPRARTMRRLPRIE